MASNMDFDVIVVGAGPGGCIAARDLARAKFRVALFDKDNRDTLGKTIIVEAQRAMFDLVGIPQLQGDEVPYQERRTRTFSKRRKECFAIEAGHVCASLYLDRFAKKLLAEAEKDGAQFFGGWTAKEPVVKGKRVAGVRFDRGGTTEDVAAKLVIDATGYDAALVSKLGPDLGIEFEDRQADLVIAENHFHEAGEHNAKKAVKEGRQGDDEVWMRLGAYGNYSTEYSFLSIQKQRAYILIGFKADYRQPPIKDLTKAFREDAGYYGKWLYGGAGPIRVRRSLDQLVADGFMVIGEAACQVMPTNGSGVASALYAGHLAAKVAAPALKERAPTAGDLWRYAREYQSGRGAVLATHDAAKLLLDHLPNDRIADMLESGVMQPDDIHSGSVPEFMKIKPESLPGRALALIRNPALIRFVMRTGKAASAVRKHYEAYPRRYDAKEIRAWKEAAKRIFEPMEINRKLPK
ncbi:MAG TPA: NAD(P)/FAD-dependent oxidoreductase [Candidatus Brocadiia bacterium]|nr:NAD(P)/FAD-dependent oxidoreductase [Candidatus Brocadiia bacterium]